MYSIKILFAVIAVVNFNYLSAQLPQAYSSALTLNTYSVTANDAEDPFAADSTGTTGLGLKNVQLRWAPLSLIDLRTPALQGGIQLNFGERLGFSAEYGHQYAPFIGKQIYKDNRKYFKIRSEIKYFYLKDPDDRMPYFSAEFFYVPEKYRLHNDWLYMPDGQYSFTYSDVSREILGFALKKGYEISVTPKFSFDFYTGIGVRKITVKHAPVNLEPTDVFTEWGNSKDKEDGIKFKPHIALGIKAGYVIFNR
jgi:hypothetical protein